MKPVVVTTSWDDGHRLDVRLARLLKKYGLEGTFYISPKNQEFASRDLLKPSQVRTLSRSFEIGAHTMTHPRLTKISDDSAYHEILDSKQYLERLTGRDIVSFCYPGGRYRKRHLAMVRRAGLKYARTVRRHSFSLKGSLFEASTTINTYNHIQDLWKIARFAKFNPARTIRYFQWDNLAKAMFDGVLVSGGIYHLWGHSWEIDARQDWQRLEEVFKYIAHRAEVRYTTNGELVELQPKRLLIAAPYFPPHLGGQEYYAFHIAQELQRQYGWEVCVATSGDRGWRMRKTDYEGLTVYRLPYLFKLSNTPLQPLWVLWIPKIIKQQDIYVVNVHAPVPLFADVTVRLAGRLPVIVTYHMLSLAKGKAPADWLIRPYERYVLPRTLRAAEAIICASDAVRDGFLQQFRQKSYTITPGVDSAFYVPAARRPQDTILFVGSLGKSDAHKGLRYLIEAFSYVAGDHPSARLLVVGAGSGRSGFEALAKRLKLSEQIIFLGARRGSELKKAYQSATIFVLPSLNDNFPMVILEAMASGLPIISTSVGSIPQMVEEGRTGYLVAPANSRALADRLDYLLTHRSIAEELGARGRQTVEKTLTWQTQAGKTDKLLRTGSL